MIGKSITILMHAFTGLRAKILSLSRANKSFEILSSQNIYDALTNVWRIVNCIVYELPFAICYLFDITKWYESMQPYILCLMVPFEKKSYGAISFYF